MAVADLYDFLCKKRLAGFFIADAPVVGSYGYIAACKVCKSSGSSGGKAIVTD